MPKISALASLIFQPRLVARRDVPRLSLTSPAPDGLHAAPTARLLPLSKPAAPTETQNTRDPSARWSEIDSYRYHSKFFRECEAEIQKLVPEDRRARVKAVGLMYLAHDAPDLTKLNNMVGETHRRTAGYSPMNRARYAEGAALISLQDRSGAGDTDLTLFDFATAGPPTRLAERLGRAFEAKMSDPQTLMDLVVMCKRLYPNAEISIYANGHSRSVFLGAFSDHHDADPSELDPSARGSPSPDDLMSYPALAETLSKLSSKLGIRIGALGLLACGTGALEILRQLVPKEGSPAARYVVVSEDALSGSSTAWIDALAPRNGYEPLRLAKAMARSVFEDGVKEDPTNGHRIPHALAVVDLEKARAAFDAVRTFLIAADATVSKHPRAFVEARNHAQRMKGSGNVDFSAQVDATDFVRRVVCNVLRELLVATEDAPVEAAFGIRMEGSLPNTLDDSTRNFLVAGRELLQRLDDLVVQFSAPTERLWAERWDECEMKGARGLSFFWPGVTTDHEGRTRRAHATGRFNDSSNAGALEAALPGFRSLGLLELGTKIDLQASKLTRQG